MTSRKYQLSATHQIVNMNNQETLKPSFEKEQDTSIDSDDETTCSCEPCKHTRYVLKLGDQNDSSLWKLINSQISNL